MRSARPFSLFVFSVSLPYCICFADSGGIPVVNRTLGDRPNVLLIIVDDLNDWVGALDGHPQAVTPNIDRLAGRGTIFTNAHCQAPICGPSRASFLSGRYPHETGIYQQPDKSIAGDQTIASQFLPLYFAEHGYETLGAGKICHGFKSENAIQQYKAGLNSSGPKPGKGVRFHYRPPETPWTGTQTDWGAFPDVDKKMPDYQVAAWAAKRLSEDRDTPFMLTVGFSRPHVPFYTPQKWIDAFPLESIRLPRTLATDFDDIPELGRKMHELPNYPALNWLRQNNDEQFRRCVQAYLASVKFVDAQIGKVIDALDSGPHAERTAIVLFSDHGYHLGEKDRVSKHTLWEEATRVPLIVVRPSDSSANGDAATVTRSVGLIDVYPTLLELAGLPQRPQNSGSSLMRLITNPTAKWRGSTLTTYVRGNHALRSERYRYIRYEDGSEELYDHKSDSDEWHNLAADAESQDIVQSFREQLPEHDAPYHPDTSTRPINRWFREHYSQNNLTAPVGTGGN